MGKGDWIFTPNKLDLFRAPNHRGTFLLKSTKIVAV